MAETDPGCEVEGILQPRESVEAMLRVIPTKTIEHSGTFWTWDGRVSPSQIPDTDALPSSPPSLHTYLA